MIEREEHLAEYKLADLYKSIEDLAQLARERKVGFKVEEKPEMGVRQLWFDEREVAKISDLNAAICAFEQFDGSVKVRTLQGFICVISHLLGHKAVLR